MHSLSSLLFAGSYLLQHVHALPHPQRSPTTWLVVDVNGPASPEKPGVTTIYHTMLDSAAKATPAKTTVAIPITIAQARPETTMKTADQPDDGDWFTFDPQPSAPASAIDNQTTQTIPPMTGPSTTASQSATSGTTSPMVSVGTDPSSPDDDDDVTMTMAAVPSKAPHSYAAISSPSAAPKPTARPVSTSGPLTTAAPHIDSTHATLAFLMDPPHAPELSEGIPATLAMPKAGTADATDKVMKTTTVTTALLTMPCVETSIASGTDAMAVAVPTAILMPDTSRLKIGPHAGPHVSAFAHQSSTARKPFSATYTAKWAASAAATKKKAASAASALRAATTTSTATATKPAVGTTTATATTTSDLYPVTSAWKTMGKGRTAAGHGEKTVSAATSASAAWWAALQSEAAVAFAETNPKSPARRAARRSIPGMECDKKTKARPAEPAT